MTKVNITKDGIKLYFSDLQVGDWFIFEDRLYRKFRVNSALDAETNKLIVTGLFSRFGINSPVEPAEVIITARV